MRILEVPLTSDKVYLAPLGDIQFGSPQFSQRHWNRTVKRLKTYNEHVPVHVIGMGDYVDFMSPSNRGKYRASGHYTSTQRVVDQYLTRRLMLDTINLFPDELAYDALVRGHHYFNYSYQDYEEGGIPDELFVTNESRGGELTLPNDTDHHLAMALGAELCEGTVYISYKFPDGREFNVLAAHGIAAGGIYGLNALQKEIRRASGWRDVHLVLAGHSHQLAAFGVAKMSVRNLILINETTLVVNTGSFLKGYSTEEKTYVEGAEYPPLALGHSIIQVSPGLGSEPFEVGVNLRW